MARNALRKSRSRKSRSRKSRSRKSLGDKPYRVGRSRTGLGLFATAAIAKGAFIIEYKGRRITHAQAERLEARGARYIFEINGRWSIDGSSRRNTMRYANHSCRPNAESDVVRGNMILRAIKAIKPGDEITYDYGEEYFELFIAPVGCKCAKCLEKRRKARKATGRSARRGLA
jgi:SET domain-containing protein